MVAVFFSVLSLQFTFSVKAVRELLVKFPTKLIFQVYPSLNLKKWIPIGENVFFRCTYLFFFAIVADKLIFEENFMIRNKNYLQVFNLKSFTISYGFCQRTVANSDFKLI